MPNRNYIKGRRKEYKVVSRAREKGYLAFRSAGSHSPIDVVVIDKKKKKIYFIQCKPDTLSNNKRDQLLEENQELNGDFKVKFIVE